jgi:hypothetical protein
MVSDFMKQHNAERAARSQFKAGGHVAIVNHHWDRRIVGKRKIAKVHASGNFTIEDRNGVAQPQQYRPDSSGTTARPTGGARYRHRQRAPGALDRCHRAGDCWPPRRSRADQAQG